LITKIAEDKGYKVITQVANHDAKLQNDQIENLIIQGVDVLIICPEDGDASATAVDSAYEAGIPVISYCRLIKSPKVAAHITFDNWGVGRAQAEAVIDAVPNGKFVLLGGSPTDNNALLFREGQMQVLQPLIDDGTIEIVADQWVESWDPQKALSIMENILTSLENELDAVVSSNDGTALGALQALKAQGLAGKVAISGQDASEAGCKSIVEGELTMTVYKDLRALAPLAVELAEMLAAGKELNESTVSGGKVYTVETLSGDNRIKGDIFCKFLPVVKVTKENVYDVVIKNGFQSYDAVYQDIPEGQRPLKP
jgi:D-xylose transport system substrate-binding protein